MKNNKSIILIFLLTLLSSFIMADDLLVLSGLFTKKEIEGYRPLFGLFLLISPIFMNPRARLIWSLLISIYLMRLRSDLNPYLITIAVLGFVVSLTPLINLFMKLVRMIRGEQASTLLTTTGPSNSKDFYNSLRWKKARLIVLQNSEECCAICKNNTESSWHVDHILPRSIFPLMALSIWNLRRLCSDCNKAKSNQVTSHEYNDLLSNLKTQNDHSEFNRIINENQNYRRILEEAQYKTVA